MKRFFDQIDDFDTDDAMRYIKKQLEAKKYSKGDSYYYPSEDTEEDMKKLAKVYKLICDFFDVQGVDVKTYLDESYRRGR